MKESYDVDENERNELMAIPDEIDVDKFLMELQDDDLIEFDMEDENEFIKSKSFNNNVIQRVQNYYPENLNHQVIEDISEEIFIKGRQRLMMIYLVLILLSMFLYSTGIFKEIFRVFIMGGKINL